MKNTSEDPLVNGVIVVIVILAFGWCFVFGKTSFVSKPIIEKKIVAEGYKTAGGWTVVIEDDKTLKSVYLTRAQWEGLEQGDIVRLRVFEPRVIGGRTYVYIAPE